VEVHEIDFTVLSPDPELAARIAALPGRRIVYTNGTEPYARRVLEHRGLAGLFDAVYGVEHARYTPKPRPEAFETVFATDGLDPTRAAMFEDDPRNLAAPHAMGMRTVHVAPEPEPADHIHHHTDDLTGLSRALRLTRDGQSAASSPPLPRPIFPLMTRSRISTFSSPAAVWRA
jgi:putative hydrolase of the HAD superfamily